MSHSQQIFNLSGATIASILNPESNRHSTTKNVSRNHQADYIQQLRQMQRENRVRKERERYESEKKEFKLKKFTEVKAKVDLSTPSVLSGFQENKENSTQKDFSKIQRDQIKALSNKNFQEKLEKGIQKKSLTKPTVPKHDEILTLKTREERNFLNENSKNALNAKISQSKTTKKFGSGISKVIGVDADHLETKHKNFGKVPEYLQKFNDEKIQEIELQKQMAEQKRDCPPGMKLMPEEERLETLRCLEENRNTINGQLIRFPIVCDTLGLQRKKGQLELRLKEIEDAIKLFSRPRVFVTE